MSPIAETSNTRLSESKKQPTILLGISGGIAAYKSAALTSHLVQHGYAVQVVMTTAATQFVGLATFRALTGRDVVHDSFDEAFSLGPHIELARQADLMCIAPATANVLAKLAQGIADDLLSTLALSFTGPILLAPAMNCEMWEKPSVQRNVKQLLDDGVQMVGPESGWLSCRVTGVGRMAEPEQIFAAIVSRIATLSDKQATP